MYYTITISAILGLLTSTITALPHDQMVNNEFVRDVGVIYTDTNFTGAPSYLVTHKKAPQCETAIPTNLGSIQVCVPATCVLYKNNDCTLSELGNDYFFNGPIDVDDLHAVTDMTCGSYMCGGVTEMEGIVGHAASGSSNSEGGLWGVLGRD